MRMEDEYEARKKRAELVRRAWERAPEGESIFEGQEIHKKENVLLLLDYYPKGPKPENPAAVRIVAYPRPEHMEQFERSNESLLDGNPGNWYPGSVGSLHASFTGNAHLTEEARQHFSISNAVSHISHLQGHFAVGRGGLSRSLATKYGGWQVHCINKLIELNAQRKRDTVFRFFDPKLMNYSSYTGIPFSEALVKRVTNAVSTHGFTVLSKRPLNPEPRPAYNRAPEHLILVKSSLQRKARR